MVIFLAKGYLKEPEIKSHIGMNKCDWKQMFVWNKCTVCYWKEALQVLTTNQHVIVVCVGQMTAILLGLTLDNLSLVKRVCECITKRDRRFSSGFENWNVKCSRVKSRFIVNILMVFVSVDFFRQIKKLSDFWTYLYYILLYFKPTLKKIHNHTNNFI